MFSLLLLAGACQEYGVNDLEGAPETATLVVDPPQLDFGVLEPGETATGRFAITNDGPADATLDGLDLVNSTAFTLADAPSGALLAGETVDVVVAYTATTTQDLGSAIVHSDATNAPLRVDMTGAARLAKLVVEPALLEFRSTEGEPVAESAFVRNEGFLPLTVGIHYIDEPAFESATETPYDLSPGESIEVPITWTPDGLGTADGQLWVSSNAGDASAALHGEWAICYGVAEAWDLGWLELRLESTGAHTLTNSGDYDVCMTHWMPFFSNASQDAALGKSTLDGDAAQIVVAADQSVTFQYAAELDPSWMCIEQTQVIQPTTDFWFFGANVPEPLRSQLALDDQDVVWQEIASNPVVLVGHQRSAFELAVGETVQVVVEVLNLGRVATDAQVVERVPEWLRVVDEGDATATLEPDGTTTLVWDAVPLLGAIDTDGKDEPTIYDPHHLSYRVTLEACPESRNVGMEPSAVWTDAALTQRMSDGSALVVHCAVP
jgi:hypothetical protein